VHQVAFHLTMHAFLRWDYRLPTRVPFRPSSVLVLDWIHKILLRDLVFHAEVEIKNASNERRNMFAMDERKIDTEETE
jgi:hypothetical protein